MEQNQIVIRESVKSLVDESFQHIIIRFYEFISNSGSESYRQYKSAIERFIVFANKKHIADITMEDTENYLKTQFMGKKLNYKMTQLSFIRTFFEFVEEDYRVKREKFYNPIPNPKFHRFEPDVPLTIAEKERKIHDQYYTVNQIEKILNVAYHSDYDKYVQLLLLIFCGMRVGECVTLLRDNVRIRDRYLLTGVVENARKTSKNSDGIYFCFPKEIATILFDYRMRMKKLHPNSKWFFPSKIEGKHQSVRALQDFLSDLKMDFNCRTHKFRKSLATYRRNINGVETPTHIMETLLNHHVSSITHRTYSQYPIEKRRDDYDKYFPTEYKKTLRDLKY